MALWLELVPKLHKADGLDFKFHQLDDYTNQSSFDEVGTRLVEEDQTPFGSIYTPTALALDSTPSSSSTQHLPEANSNIFTSGATFKLNINIRSSEARHASASGEDAERIARHRKDSVDESGSSGGSGEDEQRRKRK